jgi:hypothetical protein
VVAAISPQDAWQQLLPDINNRPQIKVFEQRGSHRRSASTVDTEMQHRPLWGTLRPPAIELQMEGF